MSHIAKMFLNCISNWVRNKDWRARKTAYFVTYCRCALKYIISWKLLKIPLHKETVNGVKLMFFHYSIFLSLFEDMYLNDEYYVKLPKKPLIFDLGSEVGLSVTYFNSMYPTSKIMAFEPDPDSFKLLTQNVITMRKVVCHNVALSKKVGKMPFYIDPLVDGSLTMSLSAKRQKRKIIVTVDKLSHYIKTKVDLLKMDIEGAEMDVLEDLARSKKIKFIDRMIVEYHHHIDTNENNLAEFLTLLEVNGFGYQIQAKYTLPFQKLQYQDLLIYCYRESRSK